MHACAVPNRTRRAPEIMKNALIAASYATLAAGVAVFIAAVLPPIGTNKNLSSQLLAGLLLTHAAVIPAAAASRIN
jgi:hypothetical protein